MRKTSKYPRLPREFYPENSWCSEALFREEHFPLGIVFDPFCGSGRILDAASRIGKKTIGSDIHPQVKGRAHRISTADASKRGMFTINAHTVTNPPFVLADDMLEKMRCGLPAKCAIFLRLSALQGKSKLLEKLPLSMVWVLRPRPACLPPDKRVERVERVGGQVDFAWFCFDPKYSGAPFVWWLSRDPHAQTYPQGWKR